MANFFPSFLRGAQPENLRPSDGGIIFHVVDSEAAASAIDMFASVDNTGSVSMFASFDGTAAVGASGGTFNFRGGLDVDEGLVLDGNAQFNDDVTLGATIADSVVFNGVVASDVTFENSAPRFIGVDAQDLTVRTTTSGILNLIGATSVDVSGADLNAAMTGDIDFDAANEIQLTATNDVVLQARGGSVTLNEAAQLNLTGFTAATSLIGALNELRSDVGAPTTPTYIATDVITEGDVVCLDWDAGNARLGVYVADNTVATRQRAVGVALNDAAPGAAVRVASAGDVFVNTSLGANTEGEYVYLDTGGQVTLTIPAVPPLSIGDSAQIIGTVTATGAGTSRILIQIQPSNIL